MKLPARTQWASGRHISVHGSPATPRQNAPSPPLGADLAWGGWTPAHLVLTEPGSQRGRNEQALHFRHGHNDEDDDLEGQLVTDATGERPTSGASAVTLRNGFAGQQGKRNRWHSNRQGCWADGRPPSVRSGRTSLWPQCGTRRVWREGNRSGDSRCQDKALLLNPKAASPR